jgi:hypothetical protein
VIAEAENDADRTGSETALLAVALELRAWTATLPRWNPLNREDYNAFLCRRQKVEKTLAGKLRRLPGCSLSLSEDGHHADLTLAGVCVQSDWGLNGACEAWVTKVRGARALPHGQ